MVYVHFTGESLRIPNIPTVTHNVQLFFGQAQAQSLQTINRFRQLQELCSDITGVMHSCSAKDRLPNLQPNTVWSHAERFSVNINKHTPRVLTADTQTSVAENSLVTWL